VKTRIALLIAGIILSTSLFFSCRKINDATTLGGDLIPVVDNVNTFDTTISVETYNDLFTDITDSTRLGTTATHWVGYINNDPLFGKTNAISYFELTPTVFPYVFDFQNKDSITHLDSVVLVMGYSKTYGDSTSPVNLTVYGIDPSSPFTVDSIYLVRSNSFTLGPAVLGSRSGIIPATLDDSIAAFRDTTSHQLRIPLNPLFGQQMLNYDTTNAYKSDSLFRTFFRGFAVVPSATSNAVIGINLSTTKLAFYYHYKNGAITDTTAVTYFTFNGFTAQANLVQRNYVGSQILTYQGGTTPDDLVFLQNTPGSFATVKIPALKTLSNRVVHRAELIMQEVYDPSDNTFAIPQYLFLDAFDTAKQRYRTIPFDFTIDASGVYNTNVFGMVPKDTVDASHNPIKIWRFNITRYVQNFLTGKELLYDLRLSTPYVLKELLRISPGSDLDENLGFNPNILEGRVRLGGGNHPSQRMKLRIIYTKIN
jgi:hypothetical protein